MILTPKIVVILNVFFPLQMRSQLIVATLLLLSVAFVAAGRDGNKHYSCHKDPKFPRDPRCNVSRCAFPRLFSEEYEGGICICPVPFAPPFASNETGTVVIIPSPAPCPTGSVWDVVACRCIPVCPKGFLYNAVWDRCLCEKRLDCSSKCKEQCARDHECKGDDCGKRSHCEKECEIELVFDPVSCRCVKHCNDTGTNCIFGTHFDSKKCKCVPNKCPFNFVCPTDFSFDDKVCGCVADGCDPAVSTLCAFGFHFDETICLCAPNRCPPDICCPDQGVPGDTLPDPNAACRCVTPNCLLRQCSGGAFFNTTSCDCECIPIPCFNGTFNTDFCTCDCPLLQVYNVSSGFCQCDTRFTFVNSTGGCSCLGLDCTLLFPGAFQNQTTCQCQCPTGIICPVGQTLNPSTCQCECPPVVCTNGLIDETTCECLCAEGAILINGTCFDPCPGICDCPAFTTLNLTVCECQSNCSDVTCKRGIPDPFRLCQCSPQCKPDLPPCPPGTFRMIGDPDCPKEHCKCHKICGNECPCGSEPDWRQACICPPRDRKHKPHKACQRILPHLELEVDLVRDDFNCDECDCDGGNKCSKKHRDECEKHGCNKKHHDCKDEKCKEYRDSCKDECEKKKRHECTDECEKKHDCKDAKCEKKKHECKDECKKKHYDCKDECEKKPDCKDGKCSKKREDCKDDNCPIHKRKHDDSKPRHSDKKTETRRPYKEDL